MKKSIFFRYLFFIVFIFISCNKELNPFNNSTECQNQICKDIVDDFIAKISVSMNPFDNQNIEAISDLENYFGVLQGATDNYDSQYDVLDPPAGAGNWIRLYFPHPEWNHNLGDNFTQDIRSNTFPDKQGRTIEWQFNIESNVSGTISLNFESVNEYCYDCIESIQLTLENEIYNSTGLDINNFSVSTFLQSNQIISCNLVLDFSGPH